VTPPSGFCRRALSSSRPLHVDAECVRSGAACCKHPTPTSPLSPLVRRRSRSPDAFSAGIIHQRRRDVTERDERPRVRGYACCYGAVQRGLSLRADQYAPIADCSEVVIVPRWASFGWWDGGVVGGEVGTIRGRQGERVAGRLAGSGPARLLDRWLARCIGNQGTWSAAVERLDAVLLGLDSPTRRCSLVHADGVRDCISRAAGLFRPVAGEPPRQPGGSVVRSEQSEGRNNRRCSEIGTTPIPVAVNAGFEPAGARGSCCASTGTSGTSPTS
jgi:hypothetical protein